ncbi:MAG TPA: bile acid:sodium symporter, partial [Propionicimonas sp.]|nr:bile acid:sodium symporter [Propionicimonas sp.]
MSWLSRIPVDRFLLAIISAAVLASAFPATGVWVTVLEWATTAAIALLFFLYGARLSPSETLAGIRHWRLHVTILSFTYILFPLLGLAVVAL